MENDLKVIIRVNCENCRMKNKVLNAIKDYISDKIQDEKGCCGDEFQETVISEECGFDDETIFSDIGVKIHTEFEHDYI